MNIKLINLNSLAPSKKTVFVFSDEIYGHVFNISPQVFPRLFRGGTEPGRAKLA